MNSFHNQYPIPRRYVSNGGLEKLKSLDNRLFEFATKWQGDCGQALIGPTGCGKTLAAAQASKRVDGIKAPAQVRWIRADELSRILSVRGGAEEIVTLKRARTLVIDELGYERFPELVLEVIGARHDDDLPTVITSGLKLKELQDRYSDATIRRVVEVHGGQVINCWEKEKP
jgi:DNA replication protein DnaC